MVEVVGVFSIPVRHRFRGLTTRESMIVRGEAGYAEWSPFRDYGPAQAASWLQAAFDIAERGYPTPVRGSVPVNSTIPAVSPETAYDITRDAGCSTAKVKVAEPGQTLDDDINRVKAVRDALGVDGKIRIDANGGWSINEALEALFRLGPFGLEYAEQPCPTLGDLAYVHRHQDVPIAADESIRHSIEPLWAWDDKPVDVVVLKVQPHGGIRACLETACKISESMGIDVVVSSALETSVGLRAGLALAAALPELTYACGLNTTHLLSGDVTYDPLIPSSAGTLQLRDVEYCDVRAQQWVADKPTQEFWMTRLKTCENYLQESEEQ